MSIETILSQRNMSRSELSEVSGIPCSVLNDICSGRSRLQDCSAGTVYALARALELPMEFLLESDSAHRCSFENFKSNVCHSLKSLGDIDFLIKTLESGDIRRYYDLGWYSESFYLLAMADYISRLNDVPLCAEYEDIRQKKLSEVLYPTGIILESALTESDLPKQRAIKEAIPEFMRHNIVESDIRNVA